MKFWTLQLTLAISVLTSSAANIPLSQLKRSDYENRTRGSFAVVNAGSGSNALGLTTVHDLIYIANVSIAGIDYPVQLDTGSSDLWVQAPTTPSNPLPNTNQTSTTYNLTYGIGWAYGHVAYAAVNFAGISVPSQAFLDVSSSSNPALSYGADGLLGLGFTSLSTIDHVINATGSSAGRSLLYNLFQDNPEEPNFIAFSLQRSSEANGTVEGTFSIGQYDPQYAAVANSIPIPTWPVDSPKRWNILLEAILLADKVITPSTQVPGAPGNRAVALLDSGTSYTYAPPDICNAIYGSIPGAQYVNNLGQWTVPCDAEIDLALQFNGQVYPVHPLDVTPPSLSDASTCVGSFVPQSIAVGAGQFDWLIGDNFLRSVYSIYDFGDFDSAGNMGNPYVKLLSLVDPNKASAEFHSVRGGTARSNITYNAANSSSTAPDSTSVTLSSDVVETLDKIGKFFPAMLGVMAFNALVLIILIIGGVVFFCKGRRTKVRAPYGRKSPMPMNRASHTGSLRLQPHAYEPVSMAFTEDTMFAPPSPGFHKFGGDKLRSGDRPKSAAYRGSTIPLDPPFTPPSPVQPNERPKSVAHRSLSLGQADDTALIPPSPSYHSLESPFNRPGSRPQSIISQQAGVGVALTDDVFTGVPRTLNSFDSNSLRPGSRPQSAASQLVGVALTDGPVSITPPPTSNSFESNHLQPDDRPHSLASLQVGVALTDDPVFVPPHRTFLFEDRDLRPGDRPISVAYQPATMPSQDMLAPPSPIFRSADRPRSIA